MQKTFIKSGNLIRIVDKDNMTHYDQLPIGTYTVKFDKNLDEFYLEAIANFTLPSKIYGNSTSYADRILNTFNARPGSTGVMLGGIKGAGKTLLAKQTSVAGLEQGVSTIVINQDWHGDNFNAFIQSITTPAIILFDEFEKVYGYYEQRKVLTLFDGVYPSRKLFLVTTNQDRDISEFLQNRPGRIYYNFRFDTLDQGFIKEFLEDKLNDKSQIDSILKYTQVFSFFNFDMLNAAVEEMNRYNESLTEVLEILNIQPENHSADTFKLSAVINNKTFILDRKYTEFSPNNFEYLLWADNNMPKEISEDIDAAGILIEAAGKSSQPATADNSKLIELDPFIENEMYLAFTPHELSSFDPVTSCFVYKIERHGQSIELHVTRNDPLDKWKFNPNSF